MSLHRQGLVESAICVEFKGHHTEHGPQRVLQRDTVVGAPQSAASYRERDYISLWLSTYLCGAGPAAVHCVLKFITMLFPLFVPFRLYIRKGMIQELSLIHI